MSAFKRMLKETPFFHPLRGKMRRRLRFLNRLLSGFGVEARKTIAAFRGWPAYLRDRRALRRQSGPGSPFPLGDSYPCPGDRFMASGEAEGHYFHQDLLVARRIFLHGPEVHVDVGSRIDGFVAHVASFRPLRVVDIRPLPAGIPNVTFVRADMMGVLPADLAGCCDSLSCLHALEHFGLGRYGDPVRADGYSAGFANLRRMLRPGGRLYLSVPIGPQRVEFNAHRVFSLRGLLELVRDGFTVDRFSFVDDAGALHEDVPLDEATVSSNAGCSFGCGILELTKAGA